MTHEQALNFRDKITDVRFRIKNENGQWMNILIPHVPGAIMETFGRFSGQFDVDGKPLFTGDIIAVHLDSGFGSFIEAIGIMVYSNANAQYIVEIVNDDTDTKQFTVMNPRLIGNVIDNPDLLCRSK